MKDVFDMFAGTSAGSMIVGSMAAPKSPGSKEPKLYAKDLWNEFPKIKKVFSLENLANAQITPGEVVMWIFLFMIWMCCCTLLGNFWFNNYHYREGIESDLQNLKELDGKLQKDGKAKYKWHKLKL